MSAQNDKEPLESAVKLVIPRCCPEPLGADYRIITGDYLYFGDSIFVEKLGMVILPLGQGVVKIEILHSYHEMRYGIWDVGKRRAIFCNQDHSGLYPAFAYLHGYKECGELADSHWLEQMKKEAAAEYISAICFPFFESGRDRLAKLLNCDFASFIELMRATHHFDKQLRNHFTSTLEKMKAKWFDSLNADTAKRRLEIYKKEGDEKSFPNDEELLRIAAIKQELGTRLAAGLALLV